MSRRQRLLIAVILGGVATSVSAHPVLTPNETIGGIDTLIGLLRVVSLAVTAGWASYTLLGSVEFGPINKRWYAVGWLLVLLSLWTDLTLDWARANDGLIQNFYFNPDLLNRVTQSENAALWWLRIIGVLLLGAPLWDALPGSRWLALIGGVLVALASVWITATPAIFTTIVQPTTPGALLGQIAGQGLHLVLAALWFGGLIVGLTRIVRHQSAVSVSLRAFLRYTQFCFAAIVVTGITLAWVRVGSVPALLQTGYGWLTLLKAGVVIGLMTLGARWTAQQSSGQQAALERGLMIQGGLIAVALIASGMLSTLDSARSVTDWRADEYFHSFDNSFYEARIERPLEIDLIVIPGLTGENRFIVTLFDSEIGARLDDARSVIVNLSNTQPTSETTSLTLESAGDGNYIAVTSLEEPGDWSTQVDVSRADIRRSAEFAFTLNVPPPDLPNILSVEQTAALTRLDRVVSGVGGILLVVLGAAEIVSLIRQIKVSKPAIALAALCVMVGLALVLASVL